MNIQATEIQLGRYEMIEPRPGTQHNLEHDLCHNLKIKLQVGPHPRLKQNNLEYFTLFCFTCFLHLLGT